MPEHDPSSQQTTDPQGSGAPGTGDEQTSPQYVTADQLAEATQSLQEKLVNDTRAQLGRLQQSFRESLEAVKGQGGGGEQPPADGDGSGAETHPDVARLRAELDEQRREIEARQQRVERRETRDALRSALAESGVPAERVDLAADALMARHADALSVVEDGPDRAVRYQRSEVDAPQSVSEFVAAFVAGEGKGLLPSRRTPGTGPEGADGAPSSVREVSWEEYALASTDDLREGRVRIKE
jgi:hypothetical protein